MPIYLTFDDGPDPNYTPRVLDELARVQMHATFFVIGAQAQHHPELVRRIAAEGHAIGNHSFSHRHPWTMSERAARAEVRDGAQAIAEASGELPRFFRPPHGRRRACMSDEARRLQESFVAWDLSAIDWGPLGRADRIQRRLSTIREGQIVLMHDGKNKHNRPDQTLQVLASVLGDLDRRGLRSTRLPNGEPADVRRGA